MLPSKGNVEVLNMRGGAALPEGTVVIDRTNPLMGNPFRMQVASPAERERVLRLFDAKLDADKVEASATWREVEKLADRVRNGETVRLACWCHPLPCHGHRYAKEIKKLAGIIEPEQPSLF